MIEAPATTYPAPRRRWQFTIRDLFLLTSSAAVGFSCWKIEQHWYTGALAAISVWMILGLTAQVRDLWRSAGQGPVLTPEERWGWRFAAAWRIVVACLIAGYFLVQWLGAWQVLALDDGPDMFGVSSRVMDHAVLLLSLIVAIASSPRLAGKGKRRSWSWAAELLGGVASGVLCVILLMDLFLIVALVHVGVMGTALAQPLQLLPDVLATYGPARMTQFRNVTTAGVAAVLVSCGLLRLLAVRMWPGGRPRAILGELLAASLTIMVVLAGRVVFVEVPGISPYLAANIPMPTLHQCLAAAVLVIVLVSAAARRWSEPPPVGAATAGGPWPWPWPWRRDEGRYYHERRILALLLAVVLVADRFAPRYREGIGWISAPWGDCFVSLITDPMGYPSLAVILLAAASVFSGWSRRDDATPTDRPRLAPGLFLLTWSALLTIVVCGVPIFGAWGFSLIWWFT